MIEIVLVVLSILFFVMMFGAVIVVNLGEWLWGEIHQLITIYVPTSIDHVYVYVELESYCYAVLIPIAIALFWPHKKKAKGTNISIRPDGNEIVIEEVKE